MTSCVTRHHGASSRGRGPHMFWCGCRDGRSPLARVHPSEWLSSPGSSIGAGRVEALNLSAAGSPSAGPHRSDADPHDDGPSPRRSTCCCRHGSVVPRIFGGPWTGAARHVVDAELSPHVSFVDMGGHRICGMMPRAPAIEPEFRVHSTSIGTQYSPRDGGATRLYRARPISELGAA